MGQFEDDARGFRALKQQEATEARQLAALGLICGVDLRSALETTAEARAALVLKLERVIERERLKGMRRHWSYDLNRHIALKQVLDRLKGVGGEQSGRRVGKRRPVDRIKTNGARRRR